MMLWLVLTIMTSAAADWLSAPFIRRLDDRRGRLESDLEVYRDQLKEVDREAASGLIETAQAETARTEIKRRILAADRAVEAAPKLPPPAERNFAMAIVTGIVVLGSVGLYAITGRPELPSQDHAALGAPAADPVAALSAATQTRTSAIPSAPQGGEAGGAPAAAGAGAQSGLPTVDDMIQRLIERLKQKPDDPNGWRMLGWSYFSTERFADAAAAYAKAVALQPNIGALRTLQGEAMVRAADGEVKSDALALFDAALKLDAKDPRARFFKGLAKEQAGDKKAALADWVAVLKDAGPDDTWAGDLRQRVGELAGELGVDVASELPAAPAATGGVLQKLKQAQLPQPAATAPAAPAAPVAPAKGPSASDVRNAEAMTPADRSAMIRGMVEGLASRLQQSPRDPDGWIQLIRSRKVLGEDDAARRALALALQIFADAPQEQTRISAAAGQLGIVK